MVPRQKKLVGVLTTAAVVGGVVTPLVESNAYIKENGRNAVLKGFVGVKSKSGGREMGTFTVGNTRVICIDTGKPANTKLGSTSTKSNNPKLAYLLNKYLNTKDDISAAALWAIANFDSELGIGSRPVRAKKGLVGSSHRAAIEARMAKMKQEANTYAGPYKITPRINLAASSSTLPVSGTVNWNLTSAKGRTMPNAGYKTTLKLSKGSNISSFNSTGAYRMNTTASKGSAGIKVKKFDNSVSVTANTTGLPATTYKLASAAINGQQRVILMGGSDSASGKDPKSHKVTQIKKPSIGTQAKDQADGDKIVMVGGKIVDTVSYKDLDPGQKYTLRATAVDQSGKPLKATGSVDFTPKQANGSQDVILPVPSADSGNVVVIYEELLKSGKVVASHKDSSDKGQTVYVPGGGTKATDNADGDKVVAANVKSAVKDTVSYRGLEPGKEYTVKGELMDKATGKPTGIKAEKTFTPKSPSGTVDMIFDVPAGALAGKTIVAFEKMYFNNKEVWSHTDINDNGQTVTFPVESHIGTTAADQSDGDKYLAGDTVQHIRDVVNYTSLVPGQKYSIKGELMDKATGKPTGIVKELTFTPKEANGNVTLDFEVPAGSSGKTFVVFEHLYKDGKLVVSHADIKDEGQTVYSPKIGTTASDKADGDKLVSSSKDSVITDVVKYDSLIPGKEYTVKGKLMDKETGKDTGITAEKKFTPDKSSGTVTLEFKVPAGTLQGKDGVVFEDLFEGNKHVTTHSDIKDESQTVHFPGIHTTAIDKADGDKFLALRQGGVVLDKVEYRNLVPGKKYTVTGHLVDQATKKPIGEPVTVSFTPDKSSGTVLVPINVPKDVISNKMVAFEDLTENGKSVAIHADINDESQTVWSPTIYTTLLDKSDKDKNLTYNGGIVTDTVDLNFLIPGLKYKVSGELYDKATGKPAGIKAEKEFTAKSDKEKVDVDFVIPEGYDSKQLVAFETLTYQGHVVAIHNDINDKAQTIVVSKKNVTPPPAPGIHSGGPVDGVPGWTLPAAAITLLLGGAGFVAARRFKSIDE